MKGILAFKASFLFSVLGLTNVNLCLSQAKHRKGVWPLLGTDTHLRRIPAILLFTSPPCWQYYNWTGSCTNISSGFPPFPEKLILYNTDRGHFNFRPVPCVQWRSSNDWTHYKVIPEALVSSWSWMNVQSKNKTSVPSCKQLKLKGNGRHELYYSFSECRVFSGWLYCIFWCSCMKHTHTAYLIDKLFL